MEKLTQQKLAYCRIVLRITKQVTGSNPLKITNFAIAMLKLSGSAIQRWAKYKILCCQTENVSQINTEKGYWSTCIRRYPHSTCTVYMYVYRYLLKYMQLHEVVGLILSILVTKHATWLNATSKCIAKLTTVILSHDKQKPSIYMWNRMPGEEWGSCIMSMWYNYSLQSCANSNHHKYLINKIKSNNIFTI